MKQENQAIYKNEVPLEPHFLSLKINNLLKK